MKSAELRRELKKAIDQLPPDRLESLADYVHFLTRPSLADRLRTADRDLAAGKGVPWRKVRADV